MRKLGLIIDVGDLVTILIWDEELKTVVTKQMINKDNKEYKILSIVEYFGDTNTITLVTDFKLTKKEQSFLMHSLIVAMDMKRCQEAFLEGLDILSNYKTK